MLSPWCNLGQVGIVKGQGGENVTPSLTFYSFTLQYRDGSVQSHRIAGLNSENTFQWAHPCDLTLNSAYDLALKQIFYKS